MLLGFFISLSYDLSLFAMENLVTAGALVVDVITATILTGIVGAVIAWILGFKSNAVPS
jgi:hypothetical protein